MEQVDEQSKPPSLEIVHPEQVSEAVNDTPVFIAPPSDFTELNQVEQDLEQHGVHMPGLSEHQVRFHGRQFRPRRHHHHKHDPQQSTSSLSNLEKFSAKVHLILSVCDASSHEWRTTPVTFDQLKHNDRDVWCEIRRAYRYELQKQWRRWLFFRRLKYIVPIEYTHNGVPTRHKPADYLDTRVLMHAYHHPHRIRPDHVWVDWLVHLKNSGDPAKSYGLEFVEGLWVEKLVWAAIVGTVAMLIPSIVWPLLGGNIGNVFTLLDFVESWFAILIALIGIYYTAIISEV